MAKPAGFDRDIGYLMPFLDRLAAAADTLPDANAREELKRLMAEEKVRWARIQQLLGGASGSGTSPATSPTPRAPAVSPRSSSTVPELARTHADGINRVQPRQAGLTVGSLKRQS
ncbi:hypothetical protein [Archangium sp.]|uniref:hypothetical protein n=1 Tax=Archangium sp. TaxID=1872627 RepID=UPI002D3BCC0F|nr:hypothetical protein [Archangium sp.]HYO54996.1 hypothetical protein [Archangium sp.]